jgi:hypothetical protein
LPEINIIDVPEVYTETLPPPVKLAIDKFGIDSVIKSTLLIYRDLLNQEEA